VDLEEGMGLDAMIGDTFLEDEEAGLMDLDEEGEDGAGVLSEGEEEVAVDPDAPLPSRAMQHRPEDEEGDRVPLLFASYLIFLTFSPFSSLMCIFANEI